jgi:Holliday junction resolvasome RuvABC endonuclease subunit
MRLIRLRGKMNEILESCGIDLLVFEAARHAAPGMQGALVCQSMLQGVIMMWCEENGIEFKGVSPSEVKKYATGKGNAKKDDMMAVARLMWPDIELEDDNHADALFILSMAKSQWGSVSKLKIPPRR